jgi:hypothetical protein
MSRSRRRWKSRAAVVAGLAASVAALTTSPAAASFDCGTALSRCQVQLDNSGRAWFGSNEKLTEDALGDGTSKGSIWQVYERVGNETVLVSKLPDGRPIPAENAQRTAAQLLGVSPDGERVYLQTTASLVPEDGDAGHEGGSADGYVLSGGAYSLFTTGPLDGPAANPNPYSGSHGVWASDDGRYVYFETGQPLVPEDRDGFSDIYQRFEGQTRLVSTGPDPTLPTPEFPDPPNPEKRFLGASPDGATAYFTTAAHLTEDDTEKLTSDIFSWHDGLTRRLTHTVSPEEAPGTPWESFSPYDFVAAGDGSAYFSANSGQVPEDTDLNRDVYRGRPDGSLERFIAIPPGATGAASFLRVEAVSRDGGRVFLFTGQQLVPQDRDESLDAYMWSAGAYQLVTPAPREAVKDEELHLCSISGDGHRAYFSTWGSLSAQDTDEEPDVYEWSDGAVRLVSPASDGRPSPAFCSGISPNGRFVAFTTWEDFVPGDNDAKEDVYVVDMGAGSLSGGSARRQPGKRRAQRRPRLITAEAIAPRMGVAKRAVRFDGGAKLRLRCPKSEQSGPCRGRVGLFSPKRHRRLAGGSFRIAAGRSRVVLLKGALPPGARRALARVRGADLLGNRRTVSAVVRLRR